MNPEQDKISFSYDGNSNLTEITKMSYDKYTRLTEITHPGGATEKASYNKFNLPTKLINADETEIRFTYDDRGNLI